MNKIEAREAITTLLARRDVDATLCPSEAARYIAKEEGDAEAEDAWREAMPQVHEAVDQLLEQGLVTLSWKGQQLEQRAGPYRISAAGALARPRSSTP